MQVTQALVQSAGKTAQKGSVTMVHSVQSQNLMVEVLDQSKSVMTVRSGDFSGTLNANLASIMLHAVSVLQIALKTLVQTLESHARKNRMEELLAHRCNARQI